MAGRLKIAVNWAGSCGGCDVSILDLEQHLLELAGMADFVYWPVALDFKREEFLALPEGSVDFGLFNGAVRMSEHEEMARAFREKCKVLVAYGTCACFGGIPGLSNLAGPDEVLEEAYQNTPSTENPDQVRPGTEVSLDGRQLTLPAFLPTAQYLSQLVSVDVFLPGCPPPSERILDLVEVIIRYGETAKLPAAQTVLASDKGLCDACPRQETRKQGRLERVIRPHEVDADPSECFLNQGILCMGIATRGGCGATCIQANMPCRGCFGPTPDMLDPGAEAMSAIGSVAGKANENDVPVHEWKKAIRSVRDPAGTFYRFTLPVAFLSRAVKDRPGKEQP